MIALRKEKISAYSHAAAVPIMIIGTIILIYLSRKSATLIFITLIYGFSAIFLFTSSFIYHYKKRCENELSLWRKLDHSAIFFLIAGTYTPICYFYLTGWLRWGIIIAQWSLVISGILFKFIFINAPRFISTLIYLIMGWLAIIPLKELIDKMSFTNIILLFSGGSAYTIGALVYLIKKPDPFPELFGFHEIFHLFIIAGAILHLFMVIKGVVYYSVV